MNMLSNMRISTKLIGGYLAIALLIALVSGIGNMGMKDIGSSLTSMYENRLEPVGQLGRIEKYSQQIRGDVYKFIVLQELRNSLEQSMLDRMNEVDKEVELYKKTKLLDEEKREIESFEPAWKEYKIQVKEALLQIRAGQDNEALASMKDGKIYTLRITIDKAIEGLIEINRQAAKQSRDQGEQTYKSASRMVIGAGIIAIMLAIIMGVVISRGIAIPLSRAVQMIQELGRGHLGMRLKMSGNDEVATMAKTMDQFAEDLQNIVVGTMKKIAAGDITTEVVPKDAEDEIAPALKATMESLQGLIAESTMLIKAAVEGRLSTRGNTERFTGGYGEIIKGVNSVMDAVAGPLFMVANNLDRISKGDIPNKITDTYNGDFNAIKNNLNICIEALGALVSDTNALSSAAAEGRLLNRAELSRHQGAFKKVVQGINQTIDTLVGFLDTMPYPCMAINKDFQILYVNKAGANLGNTNAENLVRSKQHCYDLFRTSDCRTGRCALDIAMRNNAPATGETDAHPGSHNLDIQYSGVPICDGSGQVIGAFEFVTDLTALKDASRLADKIATYQNCEVERLNANLRLIASGNLKVDLKVAEADKDTRETGDKFLLISNSLMQCVEAIGLLVSDANMLSRGAVEGRLSTRADISKHQGDFKKIVQGFNETLDSVLSPINEAAEILKKMAACDFSARVKGDYRGDHSLISNSLNQGMEAVEVAIRDVSEIVAKFSAGDLTVKAIEGNYRGDIVGLARNLNNSIDSLKKIILKIRNSASSVASAADEISASTDQITKGAQMQASGADETSSSMEEMSVSIQSVAKNAEGLAGNVDETTSSIQQMATVAQGVAKNSESMATNVSETSSTIEQMIVTIEKTAKNVQKADSLSKQASTEAKDGGEAVMKTVNGMRTISEMMGNISNVIQNLGQRSEAVGNIVEVIEEIADQTNLLALNAAIEAARAGDAGRGFAVVADEVRKLAERSIKATKEIGEVIQQVQKETGSAVKVTEEGAKSSKEAISLADKAGAAIDRIMDAVNSTSTIMAEISQATGEQSLAAKNVIKAVEEMNRLTTNVTQSTKEQALGFQQVVKAAENMAQMTEQVKNATAEQKRGGENVVQAVENIREIAQNNLTAVEQMAKSAKDLAKQSEGLTEMVLEFKVAEK